jgi:signal transduction histidine kinase
MTTILNNEILTKTLDNLSHGIGIFLVEDLHDVKSIRYVFMNKVILYEMRKKREEVFGKRIIEVAPEAYEHEVGLQVVETYRKVAAEGGSINLGLVEYSNHMVAGTYDCSVHHIQDNYVYVMLRNVTELEQTKDELELKNKDLSQFAFLAAHDLKTPVNNIYSLLQLVEGQLDEEANEILSLISDSTERMRILITDLLEYSSIGKGKEMGKVDCNKVVEAVQEDMKAIIKETNTIIEVGELPVITGYETELRLLFQNLISNGIKFRKPGNVPMIEIDAEEKNGWIFTVKDNGIGIAAEHKDKVFSIFERLHSKSEYEGTGIGLAHCKKIIDLHKGKIWVNSELGKGSTFYFTIPNQL